MGEQSDGAVINVIKENDVTVDTTVIKENVIVDTTSDAKRTRSLSSSSSDGEVRLRKKSMSSAERNKISEAGTREQYNGPGPSQLSATIENYLPPTIEVERQMANNTSIDYGTQMSITEEMLALPSTGEICQAMENGTGPQTNNPNTDHSSQLTSTNNVSSSAKCRTYMNHTVRTESKGCVIIRKEDRMHTNKDNNSIGALFYKPKEFAININKTNFSKLKIIDIRVNRQANIAAVEIETNNSDAEAEDLKNALKVTTIGGHYVQCYIPNRDRYKCGVISPIDANEDLNALQEDMQERNNVKIVKLERLGKKSENNNLVKSLSVKITFDEKQLPGTIKCGYFTYKIRPYIYNPTQCFKCQRLWHTAASCKGRERGLKCAEPHNVTNCTTQTAKCANCNGTHRANSRDCIKIQEAYEIEKLRAKGYTFSEAQNEVHQTREIVPMINNREHFPQIGNHRQLNITNTGPSIPYSQIVRRNQNVMTHESIIAGKQVKIVKEIATQTEDTTSMSVDVNHARHASVHSSKVNNNRDTEFLLKLVDAINEAFQKNVQNESGEIRRNIIYSCFKNNFNLPVLNQGSNNNIQPENVVYSSDTDAEEVLSQDSLLDALSTGIPANAKQQTTGNRVKQKSDATKSNIKRKARTKKVK